MRIILSRKGFDTQYGGQASPIMPDGSLLSLPIPAKDETLKYSSLTVNGKSYFEIINELNPNTKIKDKYTCHLDPDLRKDIIPRVDGWLPLFGQTAAAQGHLKSKGVQKGDLFLFFGTFKDTELVNDIIRYKKTAPDLHVIYGYFQIGEIYSDFARLPSKIKYHPHAQKRFEKEKNNCIYEATETLTFNRSLKGAGCLNFHDSLILTKIGYSKSKWELPSFFKDIEMSYHSKNSFKEDYFQSAAKGQEFIIQENKRAIQWATKLIMDGSIRS